MLWLIGGVIMAAVVTVMFLRGGRRSNRLSSLGPILRAPLYRNTSIFFGPDVIRENVLEPSLLTNAQTFYSPTIEGSASLIASLVSNSNTFYAPHLKQNIIAGLTANAAQFFSPSVSGGTALLPALFSNSNTFYAPALKLSLKPPRLSNSQSFFAPFVSLGSVPGYLLTTPGVSVTSADGDAPAIDLTINSDHYAGFYLDIQRSTTGTKNVTDGSYTSPTLNISHQITPSEIAALRIPAANLTADGYTDPSGAWFQQYRIRREDGALSQWVEISGTVTVPVAALWTQTGFNKKSYLSVTGSPALQARGTGGVGAPHCARATATATGKRQFEVTVTTYTDNYCIVGVENGATDLNSGFPAPGITNNAGVALRIRNTGFDIYRAGVSVGSGSTPIATGDVITMIFDTAAGTAAFYRTRSGTTIQIGSTVTGISLSAWNAYVGTYSGPTLTANFGQSSFARALDTGYSAYG